MSKNDFSRFIKESSESTPQHLSDSVLLHIKSELEPQHKTVFLKLFSIQAFVGVLTLVFCPQFELSLTNNYELFHYFHYNFGEQICMILCGCIFLGSGAVAASMLMNKFELKKIVESQVLYSFSIASIALACLFFLGTPAYDGLLAYWLLGAVGSHIFILPTGKYLAFRNA